MIHQSWHDPYGTCNQTKRNNRSATETWEIQPSQMEVCPGIRQETLPVDQTNRLHYLDVHRAGLNTPQCDLDPDLWVSRLQKKKKSKKKNSETPRKIGEDNQWQRGTSPSTPSNPNKLTSQWESSSSTSFTLKPRGWVLVWIWNGNEKDNGLQCLAQTCIPSQVCERCCLQTSSQ